MTRTLLIVGTRPQIVKSALLVHEAAKHGIDLALVNTGQHYDYELSGVFLRELHLPEPVVDLGVGSGSHAFQTSEIMMRLDKYLQKQRPPMVLVPGDTNSALASALTAAKLGIPVIHIEAGARSYDMSMAEEINRRLVDHMSDVLFAVSKHCRKNLSMESVAGRIYVSGDTMYDAFLKFRPSAAKSPVVDRLNVPCGNYGILTLHRAENVDNPTILSRILLAVKRLDDLIVFPMHPRTARRLRSFGLRLGGNIVPTKPVSYIDMLRLLMGAKTVLTDSGGLQKEAFWSRVPCITLRETTEWVETVKLGVNNVVGSDPQKIILGVNSVNQHLDEIKRRFRRVANPYGNGDAARRILSILGRYRDSTPGSSQMDRYYSGSR